MKTIIILSIKSEVEIEKLKNNLVGFKDVLKALETKRDTLMQSKNNDIDQELIRTNPILLKREIDDLITKQKSTKALGEAVIVKEPSKYYSEDEHGKITSQINDVLVNDGLNNGNIERNEQIVKDLETGSICPMCKRPLEGVDNKKQIDETKSVLLSLYSIKKLNAEKLLGLRETESVFTGLKQEYDEYERNKLRKLNTS